MTPTPGYLLPSGDAYTDEMACALVFYPDKTEYRQALYGSLVYLSTWLAWERDADKRGKDAARAWKDATELTLECMNMACLEELIADVETIRILLQNKKDCCDENTVYFPPTIPPTTITPGVGDPPDEYGETAISDWDEWIEHVCYNAHKYVDYLKDTADELYPAVQRTSIFVGLIAAILTLLAFSGIGLPIAYGVAAAVVAGLALSATSTTFEDTSDHFEAAREDIVCAIVTGMDLAEAVEDALSSGTDWDLFFQFVDYVSAIAIIYEGGYGTDYLPSETRDDCGDCEYEPDLDGFELWVGPAIVQSDQAIAPPSCNELLEEGVEYYTTIDECAASVSGNVHLTGYVTAVGSMTPNTNCSGDMWLKVGVRVSMAILCEQVADQGATHVFYNDVHEPSGSKDITMPFDYVWPANFSNMKTLCLELRTWTRSGSHDMEFRLYITEIEIIPFE